MQITMYGKISCTYCDAAKILLDSKNIVFDYYGIDSFSKDELINLTTNIAPGAKTVPIIIIDGEYIGGYDDLRKKLAT